MTDRIPTSDLIANIREWVWDETDEAYAALIMAADRLAELDEAVAKLTMERNRFERLWEQAMAVGYQSVGRSEHQGEHHHD